MEFFGVREIIAVGFLIDGPNQVEIRLNFLHRIQPNVLRQILIDGWQERFHFRFFPKENLHISSLTGDTGICPASSQDSKIIVPKYKLQHLFQFSLDRRLPGLYRPAFVSGSEIRDGKEVGEWAGLHEWVDFVYFLKSYSYAQM